MDINHDGVYVWSCLFIIAIPIVVYKVAHFLKQRRQGIETLAYIKAELEFRRAVMEPELEENYTRRLKRDNDFLQEVRREMEMVIGGSWYSNPLQDDEGWFSKEAHKDEKRHAWELRYLMAKDGKVPKDDYKFNGIHTRGKLSWGETPEEPAERAKERWKQEHACALYIQKQIQKKTDRRACLVKTECGLTEKKEFYLDGDGLEAVLRHGRRWRNWYTNIAWMPDTDIEDCNALFYSWNFCEFDITQKMGTLAVISSAQNQEAIQQDISAICSMWPVGLLIFAFVVYLIISTVTA